jgi:6-phosphogluconate dehydrogenase
MIADQKEIVVCLDPIVTALTPGTGNVPAFSGRDGRDLPIACGYFHVGSSGAGHFVKTVHNGVEYRLMQAYARVFDIPKNAGTEALPEAERFNLDIADIAEMWRRGSVITSSLLDLAACALANEGSLDGCCGFVQHSGEGRRTEQAAIDETAAVDLLSAAVFAWFRSRRLAEKTLSAMRTGFSRPKALQP